MRKVLCSIIVGCLLPLYVQGQMLNTILNLPRPGDRLMKRQVTACEPGKEGTQQIWDFSNLELQDANYELKYAAQGTDTIVGIEHRTMYYYHTSGDSLLCLGYENPTTFIAYQKPELLVAFPVFQGRTFTDYFDGKGIHCERFNLHLQGKSKITADATGILVLPGGDTLRKVLRTYTHKLIHQRMMPKEDAIDSLHSDTIPFALNRDSIEYLLANDSVRLEIETWRWYADGYRYPVFETVKSRVYKFGEAHEHFTTSFVYLPEEQHYDLPYDTDNQERRDIANNEQWERNWESSDGSGGNGKNDEVIDYHFGIGDDGDLYVRYELKQSGKVSLILYDLQGRQLSQKLYSAQTSGYYQEIIPMNTYSQGEYLLRISVGGKLYGEKILK